MNTEQWAVELAREWEDSSRWTDDQFAALIPAAFAEREARLVGALEQLAKYVDYLPHPQCVIADELIRAALKDRTDG